MHNTWLITDTHFRHDAMIQFCQRPRDHTERMISNWCKMVAPEDRIFHIGDVGVKESEKSIIPALTGHKILILGNHDKKSTTWYEEIGFEFAIDQALLNRYGKRILLSHVPQPVSDSWDYNIHGHFHNNDHRRWEEPMRKIYDSTRHVLLSIETESYMPVKLETMMKRIAQGKAGVKEFKL